MPIPLIWGITVAFGFLAWGIFAAQYIWPAISKRERAEALRPILMLHGFDSCHFCDSATAGQFE